MTRIVVSVDMHDTVEKVEHVLNQHKISSAPVVDSGGNAIKGECFGIVSLRDIAHFHELKKNPKSTRVWEICTYKPHEVGPDVTVSDAAQIMIGKGFHHLIVTENKSIIGYVSSLDVLRELLGQA